MSKRPKPIIQALILADHVYRDQGTGKFIIAGTFNGGDGAGTPELTEHQESLISNTPPFHQVGSPWFYLNVIEVLGRIELDLRYVSLKDERLFFSAKIAIESDDPNKSCETCSAMPQLPTESGVYALEVLYNDEIVGSLRVFVQEVVSNGND